MPLSPSESSASSFQEVREELLSVQDSFTPNINPGDVILNLALSFLDLDLFPLQSSFDHARFQGDDQTLQKPSYFWLRC